MPSPYTEDQLVEQPAIRLFKELGWTVAVPPPGTGAVGEPRDAGLLGRETKGEAVLVPRLRGALERLNAGREGSHPLPPEAIAAAVDELTRDRSAMSLEAANRELYLLLKEGIKVSVPDSTPQPNIGLAIGPLPGRGGEGVHSKPGGQTTERVRVIDWENPANNDFLMVSATGVSRA